MMTVPRARVLPGLVIALVLTLASANAAPLTLEEAFARAIGAASDVATRAANLATAERDVQRAERDPLATAFERRQLEHALASARSDLAASEASAVGNALAAVIRVIERRDALDEAALRFEIAAANLAAARVRLDAGVITPLALDQAVSDAAAAERSARSAAADLDLAWLELAVVIGWPHGELHALDVAHLRVDVPPPPDLDADLRALADIHAGVASAQRNRELAELRAAGLMHAASSPNTIADAEEAVRAAERRVADVLSNAEQSLRSAHQAVMVAYGRLEDTIAVDRVAATTLEAQRVRLAAGDLAPVAWTQAELERARASAAVRAATHAVWTALRRYDLARTGT